jgi:plastocyanin
MFRPAVALTMTVAVASWAACSKKDQPEQAGTAAAAPPAAAAPAEATRTVTSEGAGTIVGKVAFEGAPPAPEPINMKADPYCAKQAGAKSNEQVVIGTGGGLMNVVVHVAEGLSGKYSPRAEDAVMDQQGCLYRPRVLVAQAGQTVLIKNSDQTLHNIHTYKGTVTLFNQAQVFGMPPIKKRFPAAGDVVKFKCDVHPWMTGYLLVTDNPFNAVSAGDGTFTIRDVPAGSYTVEAWHETLGTQKVQLTVAAGKTAEMNLKFSAK